MKKHYSLFVLVCLILSGCQPEDSGIPAYVHSDTSHVNIQDPFLEGTSSHNISDGWVYVNGNLLGVFETPFTVPVLADGPTDIEVFAGIKLNGVANTRIRYPFFAPYQVQVNAKPLDTFTVQPVYQYYSTTLFPFIAPFENSIPMEKMSGSDTGLVLVKDTNVFEGVGCAGIFMDDDRDYFKVRTTTGSNLTLPTGSPSVFAEINYKCNTPITISMGATFPTKVVEVVVIQLNPRSYWNKVYVNLSPYVRDNNGAQDYYLIISGVKYPADPPAQVYLDNIKLLHSE